MRKSIRRVFVLPVAAACVTSACITNVGQVGISSVIRDVSVNTTQQSTTTGNPTPVPGFPAPAPGIGQPMPTQPMPTQPMPTQPMPTQPMPVTAAPIWEPSRPEQPVPVRTPPPATGVEVSVSGMVYDEKGDPVDGVTVTARALDAANPYNFEVKTVNGAYVFNNVPEGVVVEYTATKAGFTSRSQTESFQNAMTGTKNEVDFGRPPGGQITRGSAFFISNFPEIAAVTPAEDSTAVDGTSLTYKLTLSEPLTNDGQNRLLDAFRIVPANSVAGGNFNFTAGENVSPTDGLTTGVISPTTFGYELKEGDTFLNSGNLVRGSWNAEGTELTITFNASLRTGEYERGRYAALLLTDGRKIEDQQANQLGTSDTAMNSHVSGASPTALRVLFNVFKARDLVARESTQAGSFAFANWAMTHNTVSRFYVAQDKKAPVLQSVRASKRSDGNLRIELEFDEPMAAFAGNGVGRFGGNNLFNLRNYQFAFGADRGVTSGTVLGVSAVEQQLFASDNVRVVGSPGAPATTFPTGTALTFTNTATDGAVDPPTLTANSAPAIEVDGNNRKVVRIWIGQGSSLVDGLREIKARVENISDPAGNSITGPDADANIRTGSID